MGWRTEELVGRGPEGSWLVRCGRPPATELRRSVMSCTSFTVDAAVPLHRRQVAGPVVSLFVASGARPRVGTAEPSGASPSFAAGVRDSAVGVVHDGGFRGVGVHLTLPGAYRLLGVPGVDLSEKVVGLSDVVGAETARLEDELLDEHVDVGARFAILEEFLARRLSNGSGPSPEVNWAHDRLLSRPDARITELAREVGWSRTRLATRFHRELGLAPRRFARLVRFSRARRLVERTDSPLVDIAHDCGFADQAHLTREFTELGGRAPRGHRLACRAGALPEP